VTGVARSHPGPSWCYVCGHEHRWLVICWCGHGSRDALRLKAGADAKAKAAKAEAEA